MTPERKKEIKDYAFEMRQVEYSYSSLYRKIADLERKLAEAREVIRPFANEMKCIWDTSYDDLEVPARLKIGDLRRAAQWMEDNPTSSLVGKVEI